MSRTRSAFILNYIFLAGLLLLALNDHFLKEAYGNWLTGKLSDFAGILIFPLFLAYVFNTRSRGVIVATVLLFTYWKSPLSQELIDGVNTIGLIHYSRVVDYFDLLAFIMLPLSWRVVRSPQRFSFRFPAPSAFAHYVLLPLALVLFVATSQEDDFPLDFGVETCCINGFSLDTISVGRVYIPSAFTPDGDGINDLFRVIVDTGIIQVDTLRILDVVNSSVLFTSVNISRAAAATTGWDGSVSGLIEPIQVQYEVWVTATDGNRRRFSGVVCSIPCRMPTGLPRPGGLDLCRFPNQVDASGFFADNVFSGELLDCFE